MTLPDICLSVAYIGPKSRTERPRKIKIGIEVAHVTRYSNTTFKSKGQRSGISQWSVQEQNIDDGPILRAVVKQVVNI